MGLYDYMNLFWSQNVYEPCSPSETTLMFYLLFEAERQQWAMPFKAPTQLLIAYTGISKQSIVDAREGLMERGLITYTKGEGKGRPALYSLVLGKNDSVNIDHDSSQEATHNLTSEGTPVMPQKESQEDTQIETQNPTQDQPCELTHEQIQEDVGILTQEQSQVMPQHTEEELSQQVSKEEPQSSSQMLSMTVLRKKLLDDKKWQEELREQLAKNGIELDNARLVKAIEEFFDYQERQEVTEHDEAECRKFVFYSIRKRFKNKPI